MRRTAALEATAEKSARESTDSERKGGASCATWCGKQLRILVTSRINIDHRESH